MRKVIVSEIISLDGHFTGPGGDVSVMPFDDAFSENNVELLRRAGAVLLGATTYRGFHDYWPTIKDDPAQPAIEQEISRLNWSVPKVVISDSLTPEDTRPWEDTTRIVPRARAHEVVRSMRQEVGGDIIVFGSATLWNDLLAAGLVDELNLLVGPGVVGPGGIPAFGAPGPDRFTLLDVHRADGSDPVRLRYAVRP